MSGIIITYVRQQNYRDAWTWYQRNTLYAISRWLEWGKRSMQTHNEMHQRLPKANILLYAGASMHYKCII